MEIRPRLQVLSHYRDHSSFGHGLQPIYHDIVHYLADLAGIRLDMPQFIGKVKMTPDTGAPRDEFARLPTISASETTSFIGAPPLEKVRS